MKENPWQRKREREGGGRGWGRKGRKGGKKKKKQ